MANYPKGKLRCTGQAIITTDFNPSSFVRGNEHYSGDFVIYADFNATTSGYDYLYKTQNNWFSYEEVAGGLYMNIANRTILGAGYLTNTDGFDKPITISFSDSTYSSGGFEILQNNATIVNRSYSSFNTGVLTFFPYENTDIDFYGFEVYTDRTHTVLVHNYIPWQDVNDNPCIVDTVTDDVFYPTGSGYTLTYTNLEPFTPSQYDFDFGFNGGTQTFTVEADNAWTCTAPTDFTISPMSGNSGTTTVTITAPRRISTVSDTVTFTDSQSNTFDISISQSVGTITPNLTIYQGATTVKKMYYGNGLVYRKMAHSPSLTLSVDSLSIDPNGGSGTFTVTTDGRFTVSTDDSWITLSTSGTTVTVTATSTSANRSGSVLVTATNGFVTKTATVAVSQSVATLVSYIHTTSTTWNKDYVIDTGIIADPTTTMRVKYLGKGVGSDRVIGYDWMDTGAYDVGWRFFDVFNNTNTLDINNKRYQYGSPMKNNNTVYDITTGNAFIYDNINETYVINQTAESSLLQPHSILVDVGTRYVAEVEIVQNGTTVFFGKAAVDDNIIGLYDTVSGTMKYNPNLTMAYEA